MVDLSIIFLSFKKKDYIFIDINIGITDTETETERAKMFFIKESKDSCLSLAERVGSEAITNGSNFVFSPLSIRVALSLAAVGSKAATSDRMLSFLGSGSVEELNAVSVRLLGTVRLNGTDEPGSISFVNGIWVDRSVDMNPVFEVLARSVYGAAAESVDFQTKVSFGISFCFFINIIIMYFFIMRVVCNFLFI